MVQLAGRFGLPDDGECLTDKYRDYQLSPMVDLPKYDVEETGFDRFWLSELGERQASLRQITLQPPGQCDAIVLSLSYSNA